MMFTIGIVCLWLFLALDVIMLSKTGEQLAPSLIFITIRTIPLLLITASSLG